MSESNGGALNAGLEFLYAALFVAAAPPPCWVGSDDLRI
jgi:hypothetical protein